LREARVAHGQVVAEATGLEAKELYDLVGVLLCEVVEKDSLGSATSNTLPAMTKVIVD
jgi:hypothetical protein